MNCIHRRIAPAVLLLGAVLTLTTPVQAQNSVTASARPSISVLDSTKDQDGLVGSVRRVKTETARIETRDGRSVEGPPQLVEVTTYGIKGNRIENTSYPIGGSLVGKEEYKYDARGNITEMTLRDDRGAILSREAYTYEFDKFGNWTKMVTNLVVFENGELKREPTEVTYRTLTYYFDDTVARAVGARVKTVEAPVKAVKAPAKAVEAPVKSVEAPARIVEEPVSSVEAPANALETSASNPSAEPIPETIPEPIRAPNVPAPATRIKNVEVLNVEMSADSRSSPSIGEAPDVPNPLIAIQKRANDLYVAGRDQFDAGEVRGAVELYLQSIKLEPGSAEVFLNLAYAYLKLQKDTNAIKAFKESVKLNPKNAETFYGLGFSNFRVKRFREAADAFKKAIALSPSMAKAHYGLGLSYQELGYIHGLMEEYRTLERLDRGLASKLAATFPQYNFSCRLLTGCP